MKKHTAKCLALLLALAMMLTLTACGSDQKKLVGTWQTEVELAPIFNASLGDQEGAEYLKVENLKIKLILTFTGEDTYTLAADGASVDTAMESLKESLKAGMERYLVDTIAATGLHLGIDDIMDMLNTNMDTLIGRVLTSELIDNMVKTMAAKGNYLAEDGRLHLTAGTDKEIDEEIYDTYFLDGDTLILQSSTLSDETTAYMYPMVFNRVDE